MPHTIFLRKQSCLASQVAEVLLEGGGTDLSRIEVWIPTAGSGRRIRRALAEMGVLSPRLCQPMRALLPDGVRLAQRFEREAVWARVLAGAEAESLAPLFSGANLETEGARLKSGGVLCDLCDLLAEAGLSPAQKRLGEICAEDSDRWEVLAELYGRYRDVLEGHGFVDPNEARFIKMAAPARVEGLSRLVIACIPDLPLAAQCYAEALEKRGVRVEVLVWMPADLSGGFDAWGRPDADAWRDCGLKVHDSQIHVARSLEDEARMALDFAVSSEIPGDYAVVLAQPKSGSAFRCEVESRGGRAFLPEGGRLDLSEAGMLALEWLRFQSSLDMRILRRLLELPRFNRVLRADSKLNSTEVLAVCDYLVGEALLSDFGQVEAFADVEFVEKMYKPDRRASVRVFVDLVKSILPESVSTLLARAWKSCGEGVETARKVDGLNKAIASSPVYRDAVRIDTAFSRALKAEAVFESSEEGDVELSGWLEAPWVEASRLALCGCVEGCLPSLVNGHPFLPDFKRRPLGLADNAMRFARDAYLFQCLLLARPVGEFSVSFSRFDGEGSPALPSSLLLRCEDDALPIRALGLFKELPGGGSRPRRENNWKWSLPETMRGKVQKISPTDFSEYLACPFRFYLKKVRWLDTFRPDAREMDARRFGSLVHEALEKFGKESPDEDDPARIEELVLGHLEALVHGLFGPALSPAVRIQIEAAKVRLMGFARVQAEERAAGWRIVEVERKLNAGPENPLPIGPLNLSGKIDRIEKNVHTGAWRILDYKTHSKATTPAKKHFRPPIESEWLASALVDTTDSKGKPRTKRWADLQLPLYRRILEHWYGTEIGAHPVVTAYFTLSADPAETTVQPFNELSDAVFSSAMECAREIADRVHKGAFWPPQPANTSWDDPFEALFLNGKPEACFTQETIEFLKGNL